MMFYLWLCVVSHYQVSPGHSLNILDEELFQILGEVQSMGSDKVKVLQEVKLSVSRKLKYF